MLCSGCLATATPSPSFVMQIVPSVAEHVMSKYVTGSASAFPSAIACACRIAWSRMFTSPSSNSLYKPGINVIGRRTIVTVASGVVESLSFSFSPVDGASAAGAEDTMAIKSVASVGLIGPIYVSGRFNTCSKSVSFWYFESESVADAMPSMK